MTARARRIRKGSAPTTRRSGPCSSCSRTACRRTRSSAWWRARSWRWMRGTRSPRRPARRGDGRDTSQAARVPRAGSRTTARPSPGAAKIRQEWEKAWGEWEACVAESGDEDGRYVVREHHWEEPYLDGSSLAQDLEPIAARMRKILERVMDEGLAPSFSFLTRHRGHGRGDRVGTARLDGPVVRRRVPPRPRGDRLSPRMGMAGTPAGRAQRLRAGRRDPETGGFGQDREPGSTTRSRGSSWGSATRISRRS